MARTKRKGIGAAIQHPADRTEGHQRGRFERLAERASFLASSPHFFFLCALVVLVWAAGLVLGASDRFEAGAAGLMSAMTLGLVALVKNAELRSERAIQRKSTRSPTHCSTTNSGPSAKRDFTSSARSASTRRSRPDLDPTAPRRAAWLASPAPLRTAPSREASAWISCRLT